MMVRRAAEAQVSSEKNVVHLDAAAWTIFMAELERAPRTNPKLSSLLARKAPWEK